MLRGLDKSINELKQYIAQNASQIDLEERNRKIQQSVDRGRQQKVEVQEKLAYLVNDFDKAMDEQRFSEAQVLAKRATELDPENPLVTQMNFMARMIPRMAQIHQIQDAKEDGFIKMLAAVDESSIPPSSDFSFPDKPKWEVLQKSKYRQLKDEQSRRSPKEQEIEQRLVTPVPVKFDKKPLSEVIEVLGGYAQIPTYLDPQALASEGVGSEIPVTIDLRQDISLRSALKLILEPLRLTYVIKDEVLKVTSEDVRRGELIQKVYPVGDLIVPIPNFIPNGREGINAALREGFQRNGWAGAAGGFGMPGPVTVAANEQVRNVNTATNPGLLAQMQKAGINIVGGSGQNGSTAAAGGSFGPGGLKGGAQADFDSLINLITSTIAAPTWDDVGGQGTIQPFNTNLSLVVSQTQEVHEQIADLLQQLRRLQDLQVTIEVRFITLQDDFFERIGVDFDFNIPTHTTVPLTPPVAGPPAFVRRRQPQRGHRVGPVGKSHRHPGRAIPARWLYDRYAAVRRLRRGHGGHVRICHSQRYRSLLRHSSRSRRPPIEHAASPQGHAVQRPAGATVQRHHAETVRDQRDPGGRRLRRRPAAGDRRALGRHFADRAGRGLQRPALRAADGGAVLQPDRRREHVHVHRLQFDDARNHPTRKAAPTASANSSEADNSSTAPPCSCRPSRSSPSPPRSACPTAARCCWAASSG